MNLADEQTLVQQAKRGDGAAFGELVRLHQSAVFNVAYRLLGRRRDAEDAAQEAFLRAFRALDTFEAERPFAPWAKRIAANVALNWLESERVKPAVLEADLQETADSRTDLDEWAHTGETPEQTVMAQEQEQHIRREILRLPPRYRVVIELRHFQELSYEEVAAAVKRPLSDVKSDLFRARKILAERLKEKSN